MEALLFSTLLVAIAEIGDKTQLLALVLAGRFRRPWPIILGILFATLANHAAAGAIGNWVASMLPEDALRWAVGLSFLAIAAWALKPDTLDSDAEPRSDYGVFLVTLVAFFLVEIGDKTQIATVALAARYPDLVSVVLGTTLGMLIANVPVVLLGDVISKRVPLQWVRRCAAGLFAVLGVMALLGLKVA